MDIPAGDFVGMNPVIIMIYLILKQNPHPLKLQDT